MKKHTYFYIAMCSITLFIAGCLKKENPPMNQIPIGTVYTLKEVIAFGNGHVFDSAASVYATVTMDESNGNLNKIIYVQDTTAGISLTLPNNDSHLKQGDDIRINLNGLTLFDNNGMFTLKTVNATSNIILISQGHEITPKVVTISDIQTGKYNAQLVQLVDVEFQDTTVKWADPVGLSTQNRDLQDCSSNTIVTRTSGYATFANEKVPSGNGSLVAIVGVYKGTYQLYVRGLKEVDMNGERCEERIILQETFADGKGDFTIQNVLIPSVASYVWNHDKQYKCMKASCFVSGTDHASESWLISPALDFSRIASATLTFDHAINYLDHLSEVSNYCSILVSSDYKNGNPNEATWTQLTPVYPSNNSWNFIPSGIIDLSSVAHQEMVYIAFRYTSIQGDAPTWEIKNISVVKSE